MGVAEVGNQHENHAGIGGQRLKQLGECFQAARRGAHGDDGDLLFAALAGAGARRFSGRRFDLHGAGARRRLFLVARAVLHPFNRGGYRCRAGSRLGSLYSGG
jgi:hypothetical protein